MSAAELLLSRLDGVKQTGPGKWIARCPSHDDRSPSLSIKDADDRLLVHCFAGCGAADVVQAVGLSLSDLYDKPLGHHLAPMQAPRRKIDYRKALELARHEATVIALAAGDLARGEKLSPEDHATLLRAIENLNRIAEGDHDVAA